MLLKIDLTAGVAVAAAAHRVNQCVDVLFLLRHFLLEAIQIRRGLDHDSHPLVDQVPDRRDLPVVLGQFAVVGVEALVGRRLWQRSIVT